MSVPAEQMGPPPTAPPQGPAAPAPAAPSPATPMKSTADAMASLGDVPPEVQVVVKESLEILEDRGEEIVGRVMESAKTVAIGLSQAALALIVGVVNRLETDATEATGADANVDLNMLIGDGGPAELILARMFAIAEEMGVPDANDESEYVTACDALDVLLEMSEDAAGGAPEGGQPQGAAQGPPQPAAPGAGWRKPA